MPFCCYWFNCGLIIGKFDKINRRSRDLALEHQILTTLEQMVRQFTQLPQVVDDHRISAENQRLQRNLSLGDVILLSTDAHQRHLCSRVREWLALSTAPCAEEIVRQIRVDVESMPDLGEIASAGDEDELAVIPVEDDRSVSFTLHYVAGELVTQARQQQRRYATDWRQPMLEHVVQYDIIQ